MTCLLFFVYLPLKVSHFPPLAILIGKREKERTERAMHEACCLRVKMGEPGGKIGQFLFEGANKGK